MAKWREGEIMNNGTRKMIGEMASIDNNKQPLMGRGTTTVKG